MADVRALFVPIQRGGLVVVLAIAVLAVALARTRLRTAVPRGLLAGALATLVVAVLLVPVILLGFDGFFTRFHEMFFEGDSWRFSSTDTLIRIYPERFWEDVSQLAATITVVQAIVLAPAGMVVAPVGEEERGVIELRTKGRGRRAPDRASRRGAHRAREHASTPFEPPSSTGSISSSSTCSTCSAAPSSWPTPTTSTR